MHRCHGGRVEVQIIMIGIKAVIQSQAICGLGGAVAQEIRIVPRRRRTKEDSAFSARRMLAHVSSNLLAQ